MKIAKLPREHASVRRIGRGSSIRRTTGASTGGGTGVPRDVRTFRRFQRWYRKSWMSPGFPIISVRDS